MTPYDTVYPADSLEFCPSENASDIFVCGTYKLEDVDKTTTGQPTINYQSRRGQCLVFQVVAPNERDPLSWLGSRLLFTIHFFQSHTGNPTLAIADSEGNVNLCEWNTQERILEKISSIQCSTPDTLCLSLDWDDRRTSGTQLGNLAVSLSSGSICLVRPTAAANFQLVSTWHAHDFEPWTVAWNYWNTNVIYSGGDDLKLKAWDIRQNCEQPIFVNKRFEAGVTSIQSHPLVEHLIAVGSYNDTVRLFDVRKPLIPVSEANVGGGAWRVKWHPSLNRKHDLLVACMHDGCKVIHFNHEDFSGGSLSRRFDDHDSMAYGVDWSYGPNLATGESIIGSCSFYDHKLQLWTA
ncbi:uncharacterized protein LACBIDRAFT_228424 [Laccaria bicolor S238N-H82]|uniref:methylated diphthine methylhydrolase n=1 Tax=Laccaria bicolor (strain S238N-H82 / ATCC MYA-4686) TaxID=486041 RepID=B0CPU2_LACBS|nr:uncharacterized protein LACBIDRAFT_228424 [Laccaria bicolor S238N-H82]EDR15594.1 predicted protein [Laccaria bicolor S238N-H82]|eukprot:XP_001873802.1 predicted protein [Laccaria bicolor S238N-H82]